MNLNCKNILDQWILAKLDELIALSTSNLDNFKLLEPVRGMRDFIGDLSTWYLRRSRERIKDGDVDARQTLYFVLKTISKLIAPFAPFSAEDIWMQLKNENDVESVHLAEWPSNRKVNSKIIEDMNTLRDVVSLGLKERQKKNIPVRQPLSSIVLKDKLESEYEEILKDELNIKEIKYESHIEGMSLDFEITEELKTEGQYRELVRALQDIRKKIGLTPSDIVSLYLSTNDDGKKLIEKWQKEIEKTVGLKEIKFGPARNAEDMASAGGENSGTEVVVDNLKFLVKIEK